MIPINCELSAIRRTESFGELGVAAAGALYAFNPLRAAILLIGGDKTGNDRWYEKFVPIADGLLENHLHELKKEGAI